MIKIEDWILEDIRRIRRNPQKTTDEIQYLKLLLQYSIMVKEYNIKLGKLKK